MTKEHYIKAIAKGHSAHSLHLMSGYSALYCQRILNGIRKIGELRFWTLVNLLDATIIQNVKEGK